MTREKMLATLYRALWISADFENDFQADWFTIYQILQAGNVEKIPSAVLRCCCLYKIEWEKNEGYQI